MAQRQPRFQFNPVGTILWYPIQQPFWIVYPGGEVFAPSFPTLPAMQPEFLLGAYFPGASQSYPNHQFLNPEAALYQHHQFLNPEALNQHHHFLNPEAAPYQHHQFLNHEAAPYQHHQRQTGTPIPDVNDLGEEDQNDLGEDAAALVSSIICSSTEQPSFSSRLGNQSNPGITVVFRDYPLLHVELRVQMNRDCNLFDLSRVVQVFSNYIASRPSLLQAAVAEKVIVVSDGGHSILYRNPATRFGYFPFIDQVIVIERL
ncbi:hypothetical protein PIB30_106844, partial [Stylosanthes scabra]|nr:hypothetical protein [Stylosanthes scabra]